MRKSFAVATLIPFFMNLANNVAIGAETPGIPSQLICKAESCVHGHPDFCDPSQYSNIRIDNLNSRNGPTLNGVFGTLNMDSYTDQVTLDFIDSDQYFKLTFLKQDLNSVGMHRRSTLHGLFEDGFDWSDGYHTRAKLVVTCSSVARIN